MVIKMTDFISNNLIMYDIPDVMPSQEYRTGFNNRKTNVSKLKSLIQQQTRVNDSTTDPSFTL